MIYLDHNATTALHPEVLKMMMPYLEAQYGNPTANHRFGRKARSAIEDAREQVALSVNAHPSQVIFTASGSEANNMIIQGIAKSSPNTHFGYSSIEHPCISRPIESLKSRGYSATKIPVNAAGEIQIKNLSAAELKKINFISCMAVNNETGVIQNLTEIVATAKDHNIQVHSDAVQALGKINVNFEDLGLDAMTISSHKIYGPQGIAALVMNKKIDLYPLIEGGGQERGLRSGTENLAAIVGFGKACERAHNNLVTYNDALKKIQLFLESELKKMGAIIFSDKVKRVANTTFFSIKGIDGVTLLTALDRLGYAIASGSACSSNNNEPSHVLLAMNIDEETAMSALRISLGIDTTLQNIKDFVAALKKETERLKQLTAMAA